MNKESKLNENIQELQKQLHILKKEKIARGGFLNTGEQTVLKLIAKYKIKKGKKPTSVEISNLLGITQATITPLIDKLIKKELILKEVSEMDKRAKLLSLTEKGREILDMRTEQEEESFKGLVNYLGEKDSIELINILGKVNKYLKELKEEKK